MEWSDLDKDEIKVLKECVPTGKKYRDEIIHNLNWLGEMNVRKIIRKLIKAGFLDFDDLTNPTIVYLNNKSELALSELEKTKSLAENKNKVNEEIQKLTIKKLEDDLSNEAKQIREEMKQFYQLSTKKLEEELSAENKELRQDIVKLDKRVKELQVIKLEYEQSKEKRAKDEKELNAKIEFHESSISKNKDQIFYIWFMIGAFIVDVSLRLYIYFIK